MNRIIDPDLVCPFCDNAYFVDKVDLAYHVLGDCCDELREHKPNVESLLVQLRKQHER